MNKDHFWEIIDRTTAAATKQEQLELFRRELQQLSLAQLDAFGLIFADYFFEAYNWDLWLVAWLAQRGMCSDDGFHYLRLWLISRGRRVCETALSDPESVAELIFETDDPEFETFGYVLGEVQCQKTDRPRAESGRPHPKQPSRGEWLRPELKDRSRSHMLNLCVVFNELTDDDFAVIQTRFPRLWDFCLTKDIFKSGDQAESSQKSDFPTPEEIAATIDPKLAETDIVAYLKAIQDAFEKAYKKKE
jgi:hypothetical protein